MAKSVNNMLNCEQNTNASKSTQLSGHSVNKKSALKKNGNHPNSRKNLTPWKKGQSGNPGGKSNVAEVVKSIAKASSEAAMQKIVALIDSQDDRVAFMAAVKVCEVAGINMKPADKEEKNKPVTINVVKYDDNHAAEQLDATAVSVRSLADTGERL